METLAWILGSGLLMSGIAMVGAVTLVLEDRTLDRLIRPMVALAAGSLLGGALFHLLPEAVAQMGDGLAPYAWVAVGFSSFLVLERYLEWHHCHRAAGDHLRVGLTAWVAAAAHEVPQELGDFGVLVHGGCAPLSALTFPLGGVMAWMLSSQLDVAFLLALGAGNFLYVAAADLLPELKGGGEARATTAELAIFASGLLLLAGIRVVGG
jgi:zinc and cadmium transporter